MSSQNPGGELIFFPRAWEREQLKMGERGSVGITNVCLANMQFSNASKDPKRGMNAHGEWILKNATILKASA